MTEPASTPPDDHKADDIGLQRLIHLIWALLFFALAIFAKFPGLDLEISSPNFQAWIW